MVMWRRAPSGLEGFFKAPSAKWLKLSRKQRPKGVPVFRAEQLVHEAIRDGRPVAFEFPDGTRMTAKPAFSVWP